MNKGSKNRFHRSRWGTYLLQAALVVSASTVATWAQTIDDPLHGCIIGTNCADNNTVTPTIVKPLPQFTFTVSPGPNSGDFLVDILVPDNEVVNVNALSFTISATEAGLNNTGTASGTSTFKGDWTSGDLSSFLNLTLANGSPKNGINAWLPYVQGNNCGPTQTSACDPGAGGFDVYQVDLGPNMLQNPSDPTKPVLTLSGGLPFASLLTGFLGQGAGGDTTWISTANSGAIFEAGLPEPSSLAIFGVALIALVGLRRKQS